MLVVMEPDAEEAEIIGVVEKMLELGFSPSRTTGHHQTVVAGIGAGLEDLATLQAMPGVWDVYAVSTAFPLSQRHSNRSGTVVRIGAHLVGGPAPVTFVRPLSHTAVSPETFCGALCDPPPAAVVVAAAESWRSASAARGMALIQEFAGGKSPAADAYLVPGTVIHDKAALREIGAAGKPVVVERPVDATLDELLAAAEVLLANGNPNVVLSERGIRTSERRAPVGFDILTIPALRRLTHLPVIVDAGRVLRQAERVALLRAAAAAGADGLIIDVDAGSGGQPHPRAVTASGLAALLPRAK